ncbi:MAG: hypothetical protein IKE94_03105 [Aeriscardovia sp.]|nr:hypothetical protein [Aeriscardovia sp.]
MAGINRNIKKIFVLGIGLLMIFVFLAFGKTTVFAEDNIEQEAILEEGDQSSDPQPISLKPGWQMIDDNWYYADSSSQMVTGWLYYIRSWYYLDPETGVMQTGLVTVNDSLFYLNDAGIMQTGWQKLDGQWYFFSGSGAAETGWYKSGKTWYYLDPETGVMQTGWQYIDDNWYYMNSSGAMLTGWQKLDGQWYLLSGSGAAETGWYKSGKTWYYLDPETRIMQTGWQLIDDTWYFLNASGAMQTGWLKLGNNWFLLSSSGAMQTGWQKVGGKWYYLDPENGGMKTGWILVDDVWYFLNSNGSLFTGWLKSGSTWYYLTSNGLCFTGLAPWYGDYYYVADGVYDPTYNGKATIPGLSQELDVVNGRTPGGLVQPSDAIIKKVQKIIDDNKIKNLWDAFNWCVMTYSVYTTGGGYGTAYYADYGLNHHYGNCYVMAATFVVMARQLGFEAYQISGYIASTYIHSWTEVKVNGKFYVFDPDFVVDQGGNGFQINYGDKGTWRYTDAYRMSN